VAITFAFPTVTGTWNLQAVSSVLGANTTAQLSLRSDYSFFLAINQYRNPSSGYCTTMQYLIDGLWNLSVQSRLLLAVPSFSNSVNWNCIVPCNAPTVCNGSSSIIQTLTGSFDYAITSYSNSTYLLLSNWFGTSAVAFQKVGLHQSQ